MINSKFENYYACISENAKSLVDENIIDLINKIYDGENDVHEFYQEGIIHESADNEFMYINLIDCAFIIEQSDNVETDSGLWEGLEPVKAVEAQAYYTYENELMREVMKLTRERLEVEIVRLSDNEKDNEDKICNIEEALENIYV